MIHLTQAQHDEFKAAVAERRERPILFQGDMVRSLLAGTKTQTRRIVKPQPDDTHNGQPYWHIGGLRTSWLHRPVGAEPHWGNNPLLCPYGVAGDRLWVRESFAEEYDYCDHPEMPGAPREHFHYAWHYRADGEPQRAELEGCLSGWKPSIHMPRSVSRILLEITEVRVERLQDISEGDARAEGITDGGCTECGNPEPCGCTNPSPDARDAYCHLWGQINGPDSWTVNPWVWAVSFKVVQP